MNSKKKYKWLHDDLKARRGLSHAHGNSTLAGCRIIEAHFNETPCPIATIWYRHQRKHTIEILSCYVIDYCRRCGVMNFLLEKLLAAFPGTKQVFSGAGTVYGKAWMRSNQFKEDANGEWIREIKPAKKCHSKKSQS